MAHKHRTESRAGCQGRDKYVRGAEGAAAHLQRLNGAHAPQLQAVQFRLARRRMPPHKQAELQAASPLSSHSRRLHRLLRDSLSVPGSQGPDAITSTFTNAASKVRNLEL